MDTTILDRLKIKAGGPISPEALAKAAGYWRQIYAFYMLLNAPTNLDLSRKLLHLQAKLAAVNELINEITPADPGDPL